MKRIALCVLLALFAFSLCACGGDRPAAEPTEQPAAVQTPTDNPTASETALNLSGAVEAACADYETLVQRTLEAIPQAYTASVPRQNAEAFRQAILDAPDLAEKDGLYTFSLSSGGDYVYDKPYASVTYGENVDTYVVSGDDEPKETVQNTYYDPLSYVLSGEGGGEFAYASYYIVSADGKSGEYETVSRLNERITGYSHYEFVRSDDAFYFADAQLSLSVDQTEGPYTWVICVGTFGKDDLDLFEFSLNTQTLSLPAVYPRVRQQGTASAASFAALYASDLVSRLIVRDGSAAFETPSETLREQLN